MKASWLLLQVKPKQELRACANLENQGATCYCPQIEVEKLVRGKRLKVTEPLFPGYVFINTKVFESDGTSESPSPSHNHSNSHSNNRLNYTSIRSSRGVSKIVSFGGEPVSISQTLIDQLKIREGFSVLTGKGAETHNLPLAGDKVEILEGPFKGLEGIYSHADGQKRAVVLITLLSQQAPASLNNHTIRKIAS